MNMEQKFLKTIALCFLLSAFGCATKPVVKEEPKKFEYKINLENGNSSPFLFELMKQGFSVEFNPYLCGDENSIAYFQINDWQADNDFINILINFYRDNSESPIQYDMQIQIVNPDFDMFVNRKWRNDLKHSDSLQINGVLYGKSVYLRDYNGDGNLDSLFYGENEVGFSKKNKDIITGCFELYECCKRHLKDLGSLENLVF